MDVMGEEMQTSVPKPKGMGAQVKKKVMTWLYHCHPKRTLELN